MSLSAAVFVLTDFMDKPLSNGQFLWTAVVYWLLRFRRIFEFFERTHEVFDLPKFCSLSSP